MAVEGSQEYETLMQFLYQSPVGLVQVSAAGTVEMLNPTSSRLLMPLARDGNLDNLFAILAPVAPQLRQLAADFPGAAGIVCEGLRLDLGPALGGRPLQQVLSVSLLKLGDGRLMAALADVTSEVQREEDSMARRLDDAARTDRLTGMPNRIAVQHALGRLAVDAALHDGRTALLYLNCDRFSHINNAYGYGVGDEILCRMGERLHAMLRQRTRPGMSPGTADAGDIAARLGGDEFVLLLHGIRCADDLEKIAQRLLDALCMPYTTPSHQITCKVSIGCLMLTEACAGVDTVLQDASFAMLDAKRAGGARHQLFEAAMRDRATRRSAMEVQLRRAITQRELFVVYQPVVSLRPDGPIDRCAGVEALVRWRDPVRGVVPPGEFIAIAEECGLIGELGDFVLATACADFMGWQRTLGPDAPRLLAVNLSRAQLHDEEWISTVRSLLQSSGMAAGQLQLEVTESLAAQDETVQRCLHALKAMGIKLALDDFGTGYSSLSCLHQLPVDTVKIDRSFVYLADTSAHHRVLIQATVMVAHSLGMHTVAEGIETEAQAAVVAQLACDKGQGYLYSRPLEADDLVAWLLDAGNRQAAA